jgi:radical SAM/Cys-rich protein
MRSTSTGSFRDRAAEAVGGPLSARGVEVLQVNLGYRCNLACRHCHFGAGPTRTEAMEEETADAVLRVLGENPIGTLDLTGGAPELNPAYRRMVSEARGMGRRVVVRSNLTVFFERGLEALPAFLASQGAEVVASLPCYLEENVDSIRGRGTFSRCIEALRLLNSLGYAVGGLRLSLVYNPMGAFLPPPQCGLEAQYKKALLERYGVSFDRLLTFTNMPIGRFRDSLVRAGELGGYQSALASAFNPAALEGVMCRRLISVGWDGRLYDCDFNQALGLGLSNGLPSYISSFDYASLRGRKVSVDDHCFGCTAGQGST